MPSLEWTLSCDYAFFDENRKACMIGLFDRIWADSFPVTHPLFFVVVQWAGDGDETFSHRARIVAPDGAQIAETHGVDVTVSPDRGAGVNSRFAGVTFPQPGVYRVELLANDNVIGSIPLRLTLRSQPSQHG